MLKLILQGLAVGVANIIPGVSGGTMMVAMGIYDKLIHCVTHLKSELKNSLKLIVPIFVGVGIAIVALSRLFEYLLANHPIPTNFAFCGLIAGSLPFIFKKVEGKKITIGKIVPFILFFAVVILMAVMGDTSGTAADVSFTFINVVKLLGVGVVAAATMVIPGVSGSMMLMLLGYYDVVLATINDFIDAVLVFDMAEILRTVGVLAPFGIGVLVGIFLIAKLIEFIFSKAETHAYFAIIGLIMASPIAILLQTDWTMMPSETFPMILTWVISIVTFIAGWFTASKLGGE